jgi:hypothetical protein
MKLIVNSDQSLQDAIGELRQQYGAKRYVSVQITAGKSRTLDQNAIAHVWYSQVARELREDDEGGVKAYCKLHFGVPILRGESDEFREKYDRLIKPMRYDEKLELMEWFPVTSLMTTPQLSKYLEKVQAHYQGRGVWLEFPAERGVA